MKRLLIPLTILVFLLFITPCPLHAASDTVVLVEDVQLKLADAFFDEGEYYRAVTEYKKFTILFPGSLRGDYTLYKTGVAYLRGDEFSQAVEAFTALRKRYAKSEYAPAASYQEGLSHIRLNQPERAAEAFRQVLGGHPSSPQAPKASIALALLRLDGGDLPGCREELERMARTYPAEAQSRHAAEALALLGREPELPQKSPLLAGAMSSIIPGSGHVYAGHYGDGATSLLLNGLFIAGAVVAVRQENYAVAGVVGIIGLPFYVGNIYGAANAAQKWNITVRKELRGKVALVLEYQF